MMGATTELVRGWIVVDKTTNALDWDGELHPSEEAAKASLNGDRRFNDPDWKPFELYDILPVMSALPIPATGEVEWEPAKWHELRADDEDGTPSGDTIRLTWDDGTVLIGRLTTPGYGSGHHHVCRMLTVFGGDTYVWPHAATLSRKVREVTL